MANINSQWKRFLAVGCSHGIFADNDALRDVLKFKANWKPHTSIHLGDYIDFTAFRSGARGTKDEARPVEDDLDAGLIFLQRYAPDIIMNGNHDVRVWELASHHNAIVARAAQSAVKDVEDLAKKMRAQLIPHYDINRSWITLADTKFLHGFMYNENAVRDHAEHFGRCVIAHLHRCGSERGRRSDKPTGYCVGTLANIEELQYASRRRATSRWSQGLAFGEYNDKECKVWLSERTDRGFLLPQR